METLVVVVVVEQKPKFDQHKKMPFLPKKQFHTIVNQLRTQYSTTNSLIDAHDATKTTKIQSKHNQTKAPPMQTQKPALLCANIREICCNYIHYIEAENRCCPTTSRDYRTICCALNCMQISSFAFSLKLLFRLPYELKFTIETNCYAYQTAHCISEALLLLSTRHCS
jgi:hypothetical protein